MNCPICNTEMVACGGTPTIWKCLPCSAKAVRVRPQTKERYYQGNTHAALKECGAP